MKAKALVVLVLAGVWGLASWWWYACNIKGFCGTPVAHAENVTESHDAEPDANADTHKAADTPVAATTQLAVNSTSPEPKPEATTETSTPPSTASTSTQTEEKPAELATENKAELIEAKPAETTETAKAEDVNKVATPTVEPVPNPEPVTTNVDDSDKDGVSNELEKKFGLDPYMADSDKDGVSDKDELGDKPTDAPLDTDDDGTINALDTDDDDDGDLTSNEAVDPNKDGSVADARDSDQDGIPDYLDKDSGWATLDDDHDGISNGEEKEAGTNPSLTDSDGDGVPDSIELADKKDSDGDGILDALDTDDDNDGVMTAMENPDPNNDGKFNDALDHNKNSLPDYLDAKSSGETVLQTTSTAEPSPKDPDMATDVVSTEHSTATTEAEAKPETATEEVTKEKPTAATEKTAPKEENAAAKADEKDKITVDLEKSTDKKNVSSARLYFPFRSSKPELADSTKEYFDDLIGFLAANPTAKVKIIGHTDNVGDADINEKLGLQRAERIRSLLVKRGAPADRVEASSKGETAPWVTNKTEEGRNKNRRVEVKPIR
ncbi:OmpA family protein [uncultured Thiothrix sp.]|uniref:OmpA family protein n=1 Tax=uncultured Thiothrix sp. TaxID=223185 RepID=UPI002623A22D|nr:OmpA family protein [uncultured Thiothrix sp.]HMT93154.1 OmpA family protein [Thiolinea sp.]